MLTKSRVHHHHVIHQGPVQGLHHLAGTLHVHHEAPLVPQHLSEAGGDLAVLVPLLLLDPPHRHPLLPLQLAVVGDQLRHVTADLPLYLSVLVLILQTSQNGIFIRSPMDL